MQTKEQKSQQGSLFKFKKPSQVKPLPDAPTREQLRAHQIPCHTVAGTDSFGRPFNGRLFTRNGKLHENATDPRWSFRETMGRRPRAKIKRIHVNDPTPSPRKRSDRFPGKPPVKLYNNH